MTSHLGPAYIPTILHLHRRSVSVLTAWPLDTTSLLDLDLSIHSHKHTGRMNTWQRRKAGPRLQHWTLCKFVGKAMLHLYRKVSV